ncbi:cyclodeaminase/cyclohydrolase family protein [Fusibacter tunisiensis]|jgi:formiminotetrahydrofolate cyclodeaminase|uniref:Formiminotetrahydrofolate cyclodeaminase n=1 Tax=Fusibacter tunisiensis TaxID=1008308 RepID=A0ABS2MSL4_9FIRM|nr:cyclodeaminase/cyclohydrolase family protein [Fusibacter tunisiensis]MBM7562381.1 formiminotetrahydrofolate cyclodeaminase [Fusibacter tunisiensis]
MLKEMYLKDFLSQTASSDPVPGGGSVAALSSALAAALSAMVANLTVGKKNYESVSEEMETIVHQMVAYKDAFVDLIDKDANSFDGVMQAFKMPKETDAEKLARSNRIQEETKYAASVPLEVAKKTSELFDMIEALVQKGNKNAQTDALVAAMMARTAILSALYNVKINLGSIKDAEFVAGMNKEVEALESYAIRKESEILKQASF